MKTVKDLIKKLSGYDETLPVFVTAEGQVYSFADDCFAVEKDYGKGWELMIDIEKGDR